MPRKKANEQSEVKTLTARIKKLEAENKKLKSENKTLKDAWEKTEEYIRGITKNQSIWEALNDVPLNTMVKISKKCPNCGKYKMKRKEYSSFNIETCFNNSCGYTNRVEKTKINRNKG